MPTVWTLLDSKHGYSSNSSSMYLYSLEYIIRYLQLFMILLLFYADPTVRDAARPIYDVGSIICLNIDPVDPNRNNPLLRATLRCADVGEVPEENIPSPIPPAVFTWTFRHLDGRTEDYAVNATSTELAMGISYTPPQDFLNTFDPEIGVIPATDAGADATSLDFSTSNITKNFSSENTPYLNLREAYGFWTCTMTNALGSDTATTLITDMCT